MNSSNASSSLGESDSAINAIALSPTGKPPAIIFPLRSQGLEGLMPRQNHLPHHLGILLSRQQRTRVNEVHGYEVLHPTILLSLPLFPGVPFSLLPYAAPVSTSS